jgi:hypothetical protein
LKLESALGAALEQIAPDDLRSIAHHYAMSPMPGAADRAVAQRPPSADTVSILQAGIEIPSTAAAVGPAARPEVVATLLSLFEASERGRRGPSRHRTPKCQHAQRGDQRS